MKLICDIIGPFSDQSVVSHLKNDLEKSGSLTFKNKEDIAPALWLPTSGKKSRSELTKT